MIGQQLTEVTGKNWPKADGGHNCHVSVMYLKVTTLFLIANVALLARLPAPKKELRINMECYPASMSSNKSYKPLRI
jgi:hypothetical protein